MAPNTGRNSRKIMTRNGFGSPSSSITAFFSNRSYMQQPTCYEDTKDHSFPEQRGRGHYFIHANATLERFFLKALGFAEEKEGIILQHGFEFLRNCSQFIIPTNCFPSNFASKAAAASNDLFGGKRDLVIITLSLTFLTPLASNCPRMKFTMACPIAHTFLSIQIRTSVKRKFEK